MDLLAERWEVREAVKRNTYTGKTYNSLENIAQFFADRGIKPPAAAAREAAAREAAAREMDPPVPAGPKAAPAPASPPRRKRGLSVGSTVKHPRYGEGTILRREGEGGDAKITVSFPGYGLKKLVAKFSGIQTDE
jgi:DNA helicase-2/ATP-dependent DNA helicase PcrA